jgi:hypothetical protein
MTTDSGRQRSAPPDTQCQSMPELTSPQQDAMSSEPEPANPCGVVPTGIPAAQRASAVFADLARDLPAEGMTLGSLLHQFGERGELMVCMLLTVPFLLPLSIPGSSVPFGLLIALHGLGLLRHRTPWLPNRLLARHLSQAHGEVLLGKGAQLFSRVERFIHPRLPTLTQGATLRRINGLLLVLSGILLMAPLPLPFSNTLPAYGALLLAAGSLEQDGACIVLGYVMVLLTLVYFCAVAVLGEAGARALWSSL